MKKYLIVTLTLLSTPAFAQQQTYQVCVPQRNGVLICTFYTTPPLHRYDVPQPTADDLYTQRAYEYELRRLGVQR